MKKKTRLEKEREYRERQDRKADICKEYKDLCCGRYYGECRKCPLSFKDKEGTMFCGGKAWTMDKLYKFATSVPEEGK